MEPNYNSIKNCTYFIFPLKIGATGALQDYLEKNQHWHRPENPETRKPMYLMSYFDALLNDEKRFNEWHYDAPQSLPVPHFKQAIRTNLNKLKDEGGEEIMPFSGCEAQLSEVNLYNFGTGISFIELKMNYFDMTVDEITEFVFRFRSLRNDGTKPFHGLTEGEKGVAEVIESILPFEKAKIVLCFSNQSTLKRQAVLFTMIDAQHGAGLIGAEEETIDRYRYFLTHGYNRKFGYVNPDKLNNSQFLSNSAFTQQYELMYNVSSESYWGGSQDGIVCISRKPHPFQYTHLKIDYHYMFLLLLNQRFASLDYIHRLSEVSEDDNEATEEIYDRVIELKTKYAFRVISDDRIVQNVYHKMTGIFELDDLMADIEEANERLIQNMREKEQRRHEKNEMLTSVLLTAISLLAIFSALIDAADYFEDFSLHLTPRISSLIVSVGIAAVAVIIVIIKWVKEKKKKKK